MEQKSRTRLCRSRVICLSIAVLGLMIVHAALGASVDVKDDTSGSTPLLSVSASDSPIAATALQAKGLETQRAMASAPSGFTEPRADRAEPNTSLPRRHL